MKISCVDDMHTLLHETNLQNQQYRRQYEQCLKERELAFSQVLKHKSQERDDLSESEQEDIPVKEGGNENEEYFNSWVSQIKL